MCIIPKGLAKVNSTVCATGGGAYKFERTVEKDLNLKLHKFDELESLIHGIEFVVKSNKEEVYYWRDPLNSEKSAKIPLVFPPCLGIPYPYLIVNIGSGVSILGVYGPQKFARVSGTSLGGGLFHGLCCLLTGCSTFEEGIELASQGDHTRVDKLVKDIYGGDYDLFGLPGDTVAASFGQMIHPEKRETVSKADLGIIRKLRQHLKHHHLSKFSSKKEGYFGAVGCMLELMTLSEQQRELKKIGGK